MILRYLKNVKNIICEVFVRLSASFGLKSILISYNAFLQTLSINLRHSFLS